MEENPSETRSNNGLHLSLRPFYLSDVDDYMVWASDAEVSRFCSWEVYTHREDLVDYIEHFVIPEAPHSWLRAICLNNRPIGEITVSRGRGYSKCRAELGYVLARRYWGQGIMTEAVKMVVADIFREWPDLERLEALVDVENPASRRVLEKAGFQMEGILRKYWILKGRSRDMVMYSFLSTDRSQA